MNPPTTTSLNKNPNIDEIKKDQTKVQIPDTKLPITNDNIYNVKENDEKVLYLLDDEGYLLDQDNNYILDENQ